MLIRWGKFECMINLLRKDFSRMCVSWQKCVGVFCCSGCVCLRVGCDPIVWGWAVHGGTTSWWTRHQLRDHLDNRNLPDLRRTHTHPEGFSLVKEGRIKLYLDRWWKVLSSWEKKDEMWWNSIRIKEFVSYSRYAVNTTSFLLFYCYFLRLS